ncbi:helix-turn-helix domain-containing protein [Marinicellulosiphila megalodicopiae]|uniref:helix-turn-helix domain-containing protein n=1 Tax=Marinicellulosiphila megalodicopiae TaxID=2724896 RepID=UPI003BB21F8E
MKIIIDNQLVLGDKSKERFMTPKEVPILTSMGVSMAGMTKVVDKYLCSRSAPHHHRLLISVEGCASINSHRGHFEILPEQSILFPAGQDFVYYANQPWDFIWFMLPKELSPDLLPQTLKVETFEHSEEIFHICVLLQITQTSLLKDTLSQRLQYLVEQALKRSIVAGNGAIKLHRLFANVEQQLHLLWTVEDLSTQMHCSKASLHRHCMKEYDCSPMHKITQLRMRRACDLLNQTDWSIKQIAQQVGFKDPLNFSHRFKQWHNLSPKHYRANKIEPTNDNINN